MLSLGQRNLSQGAYFSAQAGRILSRGQRNFLQTADFSVQAGQNAVARAEKFISGSIFICLSRAVCWCLGREIAYRQQISQSKPGSILSCGQRNLSQGAYFSAKPGVYCHVGREIYSREQISQSKPGRMLARGQKVRHTCAVKSVRKRIYLTRKNTCGSLVT